VTFVVGIIIIFVVSRMGQGKSSGKHSPKVERKKDTVKKEKKEEGSTSKKKTFLIRTKRQWVPLTEKKIISHDTTLFRFALPEKDMALGLPIGKHIKVFCQNVQGKEPGKWNGRDDAEAKAKEIQRNYTPTSSDDDLGHFDLIIKVYRGGVKEKFVDGGKMSQHMDSLKIGDKLDIQGPFGLIEYKGRGIFEYSRQILAKKTQLGMIAGGTGITPMLQIITAILKDPEDSTKMHLLFANQTEDDILVRNELETLQKKYPSRFSLWYTLDFPNADWKYSKGFINKEMIEQHLPPPGPETLILMCGPPPMIKFACEPNLEAIGYDKKDYLSY